MNIVSKIKDELYKSLDLINAEKKLKEEYIEKMNSIFQDASFKNEFEIKWNESLSKNSEELAKKREILKGLKNSDNAQTIEKYTTRIGQFIEKAKNPIYEIAFVGAVKAGKSTLINAILGKNLASTQVTPETAALTKFRASKNKKNYLKISFYNTIEWNELWKNVIDSKADVFLEEYQKLNAETEKDKWINREPQFMEIEEFENLKEEILKYTSSRSAVHYFVKEVEVGLKDFNIPEQVCFVDTPGLDDVVDFRSNITRQYIDSANAVLVCVKSDSLRSDELVTISRVFANTRNNPEKVFIIGTQVDSLNDPKNDWEKQEKEWIKYLKGKSCYDDVSLTKRNLVSTSAYIYNLAIRFETLTEEEKQNLFMHCIKAKILKFEDLMSNEREKKLILSLDEIKERSNILNLKNIIEKNLLSKYNNSLLEDFTNRYKSIKTEVDDYAKNQILKIDEFIELSNKDLKAIREERERKVNELKEVESKKEELTKYLNILTKHIEETSKKLIEDIENIGKGL